MVSLEVVATDALLNRPTGHSSKLSGHHLELLKMLACHGLHPAHAQQRVGNAVSGVTMAAITASARFNSASVSTFACAIAKTLLVISGMFLSGAPDGQPEMAGWASWRAGDWVRRPKSHYFRTAVAIPGVFLRWDVPVGLLAQ